MYNPYGVLGLNPNASEDEVKKAYKTLSRKYHPDANINNPNKAQAEEKFKEIQAAYAQIMDEKKNGYSSYGSSGNYGGFGGYTSYGNPFGGFGGSRGGFYGGFYSGQTRAEGTDDQRLIASSVYIRNGRYLEAINVLNSINNRNAKWYYYSAISNHGIGNNVTAIQHARMASQLEPDNFEYQRLVQTLEQGGQWYTTRQAHYNNADISLSNCCTNFCCSYLCFSCCTPGC